MLNQTSSIRSIAKNTNRILRCNIIVTRKSIVPSIVSKEINRGQKRSYGGVKGIFNESCNYDSLTKHNLRAATTGYFYFHDSAIDKNARGENETIQSNEIPLQKNSRKAAFYGDTTHRNNGQAEQQNSEDVLFDMFKNRDTNLLPVEKFLGHLMEAGIRKNDPRVFEMMENIRKLSSPTKTKSESSEPLDLTRETFKSVISPNMVLISRALRSQLILPEFAAFTKDIEEIYNKCKSNKNGNVATYIPQLARVDPNYWGVSVCTIDGQRFAIGDTNIPFTLQSCSKPLSYAIALELLGPDVVHQYVGAEPSGRHFNELILDDNKKPHNPMVNAGAIIICSLLKALVKPEMMLACKYEYTLEWFKRLGGGEHFGFNNSVFLSERDAADRNYALAFYMRENKCFPDKTDLRECLDYYFQCCSIQTTCDTMAVIAATLADGGICPTTDEKIVKPETVRNVLSLMYSCGMYDYSGQFAFKVGLPAKSGVCGGMMVVIPNVMGISVWSPPLDELGNTCRGVQFFEELVNIFNFHLFDNLKHPSNRKNPRHDRNEIKGLSIVNLLFSAASGDVTALKRHKLSGADITLADYDGRTALHVAAAQGHKDCVKFLIEICGVPRQPKDRWNHTPLDEAVTFGHTDVVEYLKQFDCKMPTKYTNPLSVK